MMSIPVTLQAEMVITRMLSSAASGPPGRRAVVEHIELFCHALAPHTLLFGTAWVDGQVTALSDTILVALRALSPAQTAPQARPKPMPMPIKLGLHNARNRTPGVPSR